jgi:20S proteasome alpha/beta subunit
MVAADMTSSYSILKFKTNEDKILQLDGNKLLAIGGPVGDRV